MVVPENGSQTLDSLLLCLIGVLIHRCHLYSLFQEQKNFLGVPNQFLLAFGLVFKDSIIPLGCQQLGLKHQVPPQVDRSLLLFLFQYKFELTGLFEVLFQLCVFCFQSSHFPFKISNLLLSAISYTNSRLCCPWKEMAPLCFFDWLPLLRESLLLLLCLREVALDERVVGSAYLH